MKVLITGGAGYIGSTVASACLDVDLVPVIIDDLSTGRREFVDDRVFYQGDVQDGPLIDRIFSEHPEIGATIHCAALANVPDSVRDPLRYYRDNVGKSLSLIDHLLRNGCERLIFSSSASIYGASEKLEVDEGSPVQPLSPYARTKATCELMFEDIASASPLRVLSLRYFNPIGADPHLRTGQHLSATSAVLDRMIQAWLNDDVFAITGTDYPTRDGSGMRDYVHVWDLAQAHVLALRQFDEVCTPQERYVAVNLGTNDGTTVKELVAAFNRVVPTPLAVVEVDRRPGDIAGAYASNKKALEVLGWSPRLSLTQGIQDSLEWSEKRKEVLGRV